MRRSDLSLSSRATVAVRRTHGAGGGCDAHMFSRCYVTHDLRLHHSEGVSASRRGAVRALSLPASSKVERGCLFALTACFISSGALSQERGKRDNKIKKAVTRASFPHPTAGVEIIRRKVKTSKRKIGTEVDSCTADSQYMRCLKRVHVHCWGRGDTRRITEDCSLPFRGTVEARSRHASEMLEEPSLY